MDQFLAEYYNTLGFGDMVKEAMFPPTEGEVAEAMGGTKAGRIPGRRRRRKMRLGRTVPQRRGKPGGGSPNLIFARSDQYSSPIGPPRPDEAGPKAGAPRRPAARPTRPKPEAPAGLMSRMGKRWKGMSRGGKAALIAAAATPVVAGGGYAAYRAMKNREKRSSDAAFDQMVEERAFDILYENGLADDYGNVIPPDEFEYEKTAGDFDSIVDSAALELLEANGYPVEWD